MTGALPPLGTLRSGQELSLAPAVETAGPAFADLLAGAGVPQRPHELRPASEIRDAELKAGLAQMFNAFGFFVPNGEAADEAMPQDLTPGFSGSAGDGGRGPFADGSGEPLPIEPGSDRQDRGENRHIEIRSAPAAAAPVVRSAGGNSAPPGAPSTNGDYMSRAPAPVPVAQGKAPGMGAGAASAPSAPPLPTAAPGAPRAAADRKSEVISRNAPPCQPREGARGGATDRVRISIANGEVELVGRLSSLSDQDERRLVDAIGELLEEHGLRLSGATLNGRIVASSRARADD